MTTKNYEEYDKENLCDAGGACRDPAKAVSSGNNCANEKDEGLIQQDVISSERRERLVRSAQQAVCLTDNRGSRAKRERTRQAFKMGRAPLSLTPAAAVRSKHSGLRPLVN